MAWRKVLAFGLLGSAMVVGCVVGSDDDDTPIDGEAGSGGDGGGDGGSTADASTGGTGGGTGGASTGGAGGSTGGSGGSGGAATCNPSSAPSECDSCIQEKCCDLWLACTDECATEAPCIVECTDAEFADGGMGFVDADTVLGCATQCAEAGSTVATTTDELVTCIIEAGDAGVSACGLECYGLTD